MGKRYKDAVIGTWVNSVFRTAYLALSFQIKEEQHRPRCRFADVPADSAEPWSLALNIWLIVSELKARAARAGREEEAETAGSRRLHPTVIVRRALLAAYYFPDEQAGFLPPFTLPSPSTCSARCW